MAIKRKFNWDKINDNIKQQESKKSYSSNDDNSLYKIKVKEDGSAQAIIRFLPPKEGEDLPFVKLYNHGWQDRNGWVITNCPTTLKKPCPICQENSKVWDDDQKTARMRARKQSFYANILVIKDPQTPSNEGKVFKYRYGVKIHEKIMEKLQPENPEIDEPIMVFDYEEGANFKLKVKTVKSIINGRDVKFLNYDASQFSEQTHIVNTDGEPMDDDDVEEMEKGLFSLSSIIDPKEFKSYDEIVDLFNKKTGLRIASNPDGQVEKTVPVKKEVEESDEPPAARRQEPKLVPASAVDDDDDDEDDFFKKLANES